MKESQPTKWTTAHELKFIESIKSIIIAENKKTSRLSELDLLQKYVEAAKKRVNWGNIDPVIVMAKANERIRRLMSGVAA